MFSQDLHDDDEATDNVIVAYEHHYQCFKPSQTTVLQALNSSPDPNALARSLDALQPRYIILYDVDISYIRQIEVS